MRRGKLLGQKLSVAVPEIRGVSTCALILVVVLPQSYSGTNCERSVLSCRELFCFNGGSCQSMQSGARCYCLPGWAGPDCRLRANSSCANLPCHNGGACLETSRHPYFQCICPDDFTGIRCQTARSVLPPPPPEPHCPLEECAAKAGDSYCDKMCNSPACHWDGGDCSLLVDDPWKQCKIRQCWQYFNNSQCDELCNTVECLYDNFDCKNQERTCK